MITREISIIRRDFQLNLLPSKLALLLVFALVGGFSSLPALLSAETITTQTLTLSNLFEWEEDKSSPQRQASFSRPDTSAWRQPAATPTPAATPVAKPLPVEVVRRLEESASRRRQVQEIREHNRPAFTFRRLTTNPEFPGHAQVSIASQYNRFFTEYRLIPVNVPNLSAGMETIRFFHAPNSTETFWIPAGTWRLEREVWLLENETRIKQNFPAQQLRPGGRYYFETNQLSDENSLIRRLGGRSAR